MSLQRFLSLRLSGNAANAPLDDSRNPSLTPRLDTAARTCEDSRPAPAEPTQVTVTPVVGRILQQTEDPKRRAIRALGCKNSSMIRACKDPDTATALFALYEIFWKVDGNDDGKLTMEEFVAMLTIIDQKRTLTEVMDMVRMYDTDNDGLISYDEFLLVMVMEGYRELFRAMDSNGDNVLSRTEFVRGMALMGVGGETSRLFDVVDQDKNGSLSYLEFATFMKVASEKN